MKVTITNWDAVATWRWDIPEDDVCGICQVHFDGTCPTCKYPGDDCSLCKCSPLSWPHLSFCVYPIVMELRAD
jgi:anaphase-promoting complex subunit 11